MGGGNGMETDDFWVDYANVCARGYSVFGRTVTPGDFVGPGCEWHFHGAQAPSYAAEGRMRFTKTLHLARSLKPTSILEVAGGGGFLAACLADKGHRVVLNDLRPTESLANWRTPSGIEFVAGDLFALDAATLGRFDLVIACDVIEHVAHGDQFVRHLASLLAPGGHMLITTPNGRFFRNKLPTYAQVADFAALESRQFQPDADGHLYLYTPNELTGLLTGAGLRVVHQELTTSPFISGNAGFRFLPRGGLTHRAAVAGERLLAATPWRLRERLFTQMYVIATQAHNEALHVHRVDGGR